MPYIRIHRRLRYLVLCLIGASVLIATPVAAGSAWSVAGPLAAPTAPTLGDIAADTPTAVALGYEPATQTLQLRLDFSVAPSRNPIRVDAGIAQPDGTCVASGLSIAIAAQDHMVTSTTTMTTQTWVSPRTEVGWSYSSRYPPGVGNWTYLSYDRWSMRYQWLHSIPGYWLQEAHEVTSAEPDPTTHERVAGLSLATADGVLADTELVANDSTGIGWTFTSPLFENAPPTCLAVHVANRRAPFLLTPGAITVDENHATQAPDTTGLPRARAHKVGHRLHLRLLGLAGAIQVRIGTRSTPPLLYASVLSLKLGSKAPTSIAVRFRRGGTWSAWRTVPVSSLSRQR